MRRFLNTITIAIAITLAVASACVSPTAGVPIELTVAFEGLGPSTFVTVSGWEVELTEARAVVAPIYAYAPSDASALYRALGPARALAHGGVHPLDGRVLRAELLEPQVMDALAGPSDVARLDGFAGAIDALTVVLASEPSDATQGHAVWVAGVARRDGVEVTFEGGLEITDERLARIDGVEVDPDAPLDEGSRLVVGANASAWLAEADFTDITGAITPESQPHRALFLGARSAASWSARVEGAAHE